MENSGKDMLVDNSLFSNGEMIGYMRETAKWAKFLAIVGFIGLGFIVIAAIFMIATIGTIPGMGAPGALIGFIYLVIGALHFFPVMYMYNFAVKTAQGVDAEDKHTFTLGVENLKSLFKFMGIFTIVILSIYGLALLIGILMIIAR